MRFILLAAFALMMAGSPLDDDRGAPAEGEKWLSLLDNNQYDESWKQAASMFRDKVQQDQWIASLKQFREPLGGMVSRSTARVDFTKVLRGAPDADYSIIHFTTNFKNKTAVTERLTLVREENKWAAAAYAIH